MTALSRIPFRGAELYAAKINDVPHVAVKPVCEAIGIDHSSQIKRLKRQPWAGMAIMTTPSAGGSQETTMVDRRTFTMWLATIETSRLKNEKAKETLIAFQREAADALDRYFNEGGAINPRAEEHQINALIRQSQMRMELIQAAKGIIHPDHLEAKAQVVLAQGMGEAPALDPATMPLYTQDFLKEKGLSAKQMRSKAPTFGKRLKAAYVEKHGVEPERYPLNFQNGQTRMVNAYTEADRPLMEGVWNLYYNDTPTLEMV